MDVGTQKTFGVHGVHSELALSFSSKQVSETGKYSDAQIDSSDFDRPNEI
jgi:hypothetical protein